MLVKGTGGYGQYKKCPGLDIIEKRVRPYKTYYQCEDCSMEKGECVYLCNARKPIQQVTNHMRHHMEIFLETADTTRYSVDSDLTDRS